MLNPIGPNGESLVKASPTIARLVERHSTSRNREPAKVGPQMNMTQQHLNLSSELASILDAATKM
jgi:hypothetical protein